MAVRDRFLQCDQHFDSLLISSPQGHSGKTLVAIGLCEAFRRRGLWVQPFKKGPDYIDPSWLSAAAGRACRNLDLFLIPEDRLLHAFQRTMEGADLAVVEGAMGLFDGFDSPESGTTAEIARLFQIPVFLVVNTTRMTSSIAAMVTGYQHFQPDIRIAGVILNQVSGSRHEQKLSAAVERYCQIPVVGSIPRDLDLKIDERHLGLTPFRESKESESMIKRIGRKLELYLDLDQLLKILKNFEKPLFLRPSKERGAVKMKEKGASKVKIGVMYDQVFHFYYPENFEALKEEGAELIFIHSLKDRLPEIDGLYIGGGFPEFFLEELERNRALRHEIREAIEEGLPVYAECAGLMYLCQSIEGKDRSYEMAGVLPARVKISQRPQGHGYVISEVIKKNSFFPLGSIVRGHEFHHSNLVLLEPCKFAYRIRRGHGIQGEFDGMIYKNLFATYTHLHALGTQEWAPAFVSLISKGRKVKIHSKKIKPSSSFPLYT